MTRLISAVVLALACTGVAACDDNPVAPSSLEPGTPSPGVFRNELNSIPDTGRRCTPAVRLPRDAPLRC